MPDIMGNFGRLGQLAMLRTLSINAHTAEYVAQALTAAAAARSTRSVITPEAFKSNCPYAVILNDAETVPLVGNSAPWLQPLRTVGQQG